MVRNFAVLCVLMCACGEEERLRAIAPPEAPAVAPTAPSPPAYSIPAPIAPPTVPLPVNEPRVIPHEWLTVEPSPLYIFGNDAKPSGPQSVTLANLGSDTMAISAALSGSATLSLAQPIDGAVLAPGDTLQVTVAFAPTDHDTAGAMLTISASTGRTYSVPVTAQQFLQ
jgi:hypothetical protein